MTNYNKKRGVVKTKTGKCFYFMYLIFEKGELCDSPPKGELNTVLKEVNPYIW